MDSSPSLACRPHNACPVPARHQVRILILIGLSLSCSGSKAVYQMQRKARRGPAADGSLPGLRTRGIVRSFVAMHLRRA
ncbi:hypothetical protein G6F40_017950 [Rhizopus arrhizus]|nr:hypothetical protein G6F40_017950 [Rhizopus arrhizus]